MRTPIRKAGTYTHTKPDPHMTEAKYNDLKANLDRLLKFVRPKLAKEVKILSETGDYSENAGYQMAKGRLRGVNQRIIELEDLIKRAVVIKNLSIDKIQIGNQVTLDVDGKTRIYQILGGTETDPAKGVISHESAIGRALLGHKVGDVIKIELPKKIVKYTIKKIS